MAGAPLADLPKSAPLKKFEDIPLNLCFWKVQNLRPVLKPPKIKKKMCFRHFLGKHVAKKNYPPPSSG